MVDFARRRLHFHFRFSRHLHFWLLAAPEDQETKADSWLARLALLQYATLRTLNAARHRTIQLHGEHADRSLWQAALEGAGPAF